MFNSHMKGKVKSCNTGISAPCCSSVRSKNKNEKHYSAPKKTKCLKTVKERNQIRWQRSSRSNQSHQHCERGSKDKENCSERSDFQSSRSLIFSRKEKPVAKPFPSHKLSIITEGRLTSIRGLFSHEVRSVDIERLVKEKNNRKRIEKQEGQATASNSQSLSCLITHSTPPVVISETSEEGISACANIDQTSDILEKPDHLQTNLDSVPRTMHSKDDGAHKTTYNTAMCGSPSGEKEIQKAVIVSSSESEPVHRSSPASVKVSPSDHNDNPKKKHVHGQKRTNKATAAVDVQPDFINTEKLTPAGSEVLNSDAPQFNRSPEIFMSSTPTLNREKTGTQEHRKPVFPSKEEAVSRLAARLCGSLVSFPLQHDRPLLTECRSVLLHHLQERHGSQLQHSLCRLQSHLSAEGPHSSQTAEQVWPSGPSVLKYSENTQMCFSFTRKNEEYDQQSETMESQTDNDLQKFEAENVERGATSREQRQCPWGIYSHQDFVTKLQRPSQNMLSHSSVTAQFEEPFTARQQSNSQRFSLQQSFTGPHTSTPWSYNCTDRILDPFFLEPQKQAKFGSEENRSTGLPLLEQWRNDPDLNFLFQEEDSNTTHTIISPLTELRTSSVHHNIENVTERPLFGTSSTVLSLFSPEGFHYKPYYRFPHPSYAFNSSLYTQLDVEKRSLCPSLHLTTPTFDYWP